MAPTIPVYTLGLPPEFIEASSGYTTRVRNILGEASSRRVTVQAWGGSITEGTGSTDIRNLSWLGRVRTGLINRYGDGGAGYLPLHFADAGFSGWSLIVGFGATEWRATAAASANFTNIGGTEIRIFHRQLTPGTFRYRIDGGSFTNVSPPTGFGAEPGSVVISSLSDTAHTVDIEWVSGTIGVCGIEGRRATGIVVQRCCVGGRGMSDYAQQIVRRSTIGITDTLSTITCVAPGHFTSDDVNRYLVGDTAGLPDNAQITAVASATSATISAPATATNAALLVDVGRINPFSVAAPLMSKGNVFAPGLVGGGTGADLIIPAIGVNDAGTQNATIDSFGYGLGQVLGGSGDAHREVLIVSEHQAAFADFGLANAIRGLAAGVAAAKSGAFVNVWGMGRHSFTYWNNLGMFFDSVHPSDLGHETMANKILQLLVG